MDYTIKDIENQIKAITNCADCTEIDGCYCCRQTKPSFNEIREMLKDYLNSKIS